MANKQTQPGLAQVQGTYVNTNGNPLIPQTNWKSPLREIAKIGEQGVNLAKQYQDIKFDGYQAQYSIMANQMYHEMQDATDPTQLDEIQAKYEQKFAEPLEDNIWAKSYLKSQYRQKWDNTMKENSLKVRYAMQHKFNVIETEKTLNSMAMAAASTGDINAMTSYFDSGIALIDSQEMSVDEKNAAKKAYAKFFVNANFNSNPNLANSFAQQYAGELAPYGVDANEIKTKTDSYNVQQENRLYTKKTRAEKEKKDAAMDLGANALYEFLKKGSPTNEDYTNIDSVIDKVAEVNPVYALKMQKAVYPEETTSPKARMIEDIADQLEEYQKDPSNEALRLEIKDKIGEAARRNYASKELQKTWYSELGISGDGGKDYILLAKTQTEQEFQETLASAEDLKGYNVSALEKINKESQGYNGRVNYIIDKQGVVSNEEIESWRDKYGFSEAQIVSLKDKAQTERANHNRGSVGFEELLDGLSNIDKMPKNAKEIYSKLPDSERVKFQERVKARIKLVQEKRMEELHYQAENGDLSLQQVRTLYYDRAIDKDQFGDLVDTINRKATDTLETQKADILSNIVNRKYNDMSEMLADFERLKYDESNRNQRLSDLTSFKNLYKDVISDVKSLISNIFATADDMYERKSPVLGTMDTVTPIRLAQFKEAISREVMEDWNNKKSFSEINQKYNVLYLNEQWELYRPSNEEVIRNSLARLYSTSDEVDVTTDSTGSNDTTEDGGKKPTPVTEAINFLKDLIAPTEEKKKTKGKEKENKEGKKVFDEFVREKNKGYKVEKNGDITFGDK